MRKQLVDCVCRYRKNEQARKEEMIRNNVVILKGDLQRRDTEHAMRVACI